MTNTEQIFNMVLAFLGKHGIPVGGLSLLGDVFLKSGEKFDMLWARIDGGADQVRVFHNGCCVFNSKFDGRLHVYPPLGDTAAWAETVVSDNLLPLELGTSCH